MKYSKLLILASVLLICVGVFPQHKNPSERYLNEYKTHLNASCPIPSSNIKHFVYFARDRESLRGHTLFTSTSFSGAQIMYSWRQLEPEKNKYDFAKIDKDLKLLLSHKKKLFIQLQDATFSPQYKAVPEYLLSEKYGGGVTPQFTDDGVQQGWVAKRWNPMVQDRFSKLLRELGRRFDGRIEGINLQESAIGVSPETDETFSHRKYVNVLKKNMHAMKIAFPRSVKIQYANFMPGEWMPWEDNGFLRSIYKYGEEAGVGLGAPDLMIRRKGQLNHAFAMMHEGTYSVPLAIAVQDGNYIGETGTMTVRKNRKNLVPQLFSFAEKFLRVDYMFWANQKPYFEQDVLPCFGD